MRIFAKTAAVAAPAILFERLTAELYCGSRQRHYGWRQRLYGASCVTIHACPQAWFSVAQLKGIHAAHKLA